MLANEFIRLPIHMIDKLPDGTPRWGAAHKQAMRAWHRRSIVIMGPTQQIPTASARVTVDPAVRDRWGLPVARIEGNVHQHADRGCMRGSAAWPVTTSTTRMRLLRARRVTRRCRTAASRWRRWTRPLMPRARTTSTG